MTDTQDIYEIDQDIWEKICKILDIETSCSDLDFLEAIIISKNSKEKETIIKQEPYITTPQPNPYPHRPYWDNGPYIID